MLTILEASLGDNGALVYVAVYARRGNPSKALEWLETALRLRNPNLAGLKVDPLFDPLRNEPRVQAVVRELRFPD